MEYVSITSYIHMRPTTVDTSTLRILRNILRTNNTIVHNTSKSSKITKALPKHGYMYYTIM